MTHREPLLEPVAIGDLRPTQITVGYREVSEKRKAWRERDGVDGSEFLGRHMIPVLKGPKGRPYVIDHHHLARALLDEGVKKIAVNVVADLSKLGKDEFWVLCDNKGWCHPYDAQGVRRGMDAIPAVTGQRMPNLPDCATRRTQARPTSFLPRARTSLTPTCSTSPRTRDFERKNQSQDSTASAGSVSVTKNQ